jgi:hypothetical protein
MCVIIGEAVEDYDESGNPTINPVNLHRGANYVEEGEYATIVTARPKVWLTTDEWATIKEVVEGMTHP